MKIRSDFVSNSSASSFVCEVCGNRYNGWDGEYEDDIREYGCVNGHTFCSECVMESDSKCPHGHDDAYPLVCESEDYDECSNCESYTSKESLPEESCLACQLKMISFRDKIKYLRKKSGMSKDEILGKTRKDGAGKLLKQLNMTDQDIVNEIHERFKTYADFTKYICGED